MRRSGLALFCTLDSGWTQRVRIVAGEKGLPLELVEVPEGGRNAELAEMSPDATLPTLVDRDVLLFDSRVIIDYLDERFPHPPLMPIDPVTRAQFRVALHRIEREWYPAAEAIAVRAGSKERPLLRERLRTLLLDSAAVFKVKRYFTERRVLTGRCDDRADTLASASPGSRPCWSRWPGDHALCEPDLCAAGFSA